MKLNRLKSNCPQPYKISFKSEKDAWLKCLKLWKERQIDQSPYFCSPCGNWHITSEKKIIPDWVRKLM